MSAETHTGTGPGAAEPATEEDLARWFRCIGRKVVERDGRYWVAGFGFYRRIHFLGETPPEELRRPAATCWGFQTAVPAGAYEVANARLPLHLIEDLASYDSSSPDKTKRKHIRRAARALEVRVLDDPNRLRSEGWPIFSANRDRLRRWTSRWQGLSRADFHDRVEQSLRGKGRIVTGAYDGDRLLGFLESYVVEDIVYLDEIFLTPEATSRGAGTLLYFEIAQLCRGMKAVRRLCAGPHLPERPGVTDFKTRMGIPLVEVPGHVWMLPGASALFRRLRPLGHYRATGAPLESPTRGASASERPVEEVDAARR